ncbi:MAG: hypothetical protein K2K75_00580 [Muribaculaceae bacterium]|nr:hypothetical protein [Muribaculaceae bacterium]
MNTNYDDEATSLNTKDNEATQYADENQTTQKESGDSTINEEESTANEDQSNVEDQKQENNEDITAEESKPKKDWKKVAISAGSGVLLGVGSTLFMGMQSANADVEPIVTDDPHNQWTDGKVEVATGVNDGMSFGEAFATAREEVGPGGVFEWHGNVYATYSKEEWDMMSPEDRAEFNSHFAWNQGNNHSSGNNSVNHTHTAQNEDIIIDQDFNDSPSEQNQHNSSSTEAITGDDDINVISVDNPQESNLTAHTTPHSTNGDDISVTSAEPEIEILGVVHDADAGANIGGLMVDGHEVVVVDLDGDMIFDVMAVDANSNGTLENNEVVDIHDQGLTVAGLGGFSNPTGDLMASNDAPDYTSDPIYEG